jgi:hypothetical protein
MRVQFIAPLVLTILTVMMLAVPAKANCTSSPSQNLAGGYNTIDFQTPHPYTNDMDCWSNVYICPSGTYANTLVKYDTESGYDYFNIYNNDDYTYTRWDGDSGGFVWREHPNTRSVSFRFTSDYSLIAWGVDVDTIYCYEPTTTTTTTMPTTTTTTTMPTTTTTTTIPSGPPPCQVCDIGNLSGGVLSLGSIPAAFVCGFLNILFCVPILFVIALFAVGGFYYWRKLKR